MIQVKTEENQKELKEKVIQIDRVSRVVKGGRRMRFRATVVVGDENGKVGVGIGKGTEVLIAISKAKQKAQKSMAEIEKKGTTIPHEITKEFCGARVFLKPARPGTGVVAGGAVRAVLEVAGIRDILSKILGSSNKINNVYATFEALRELKRIPKKESENKEKEIKNKEIKKVKDKKEAEKKISNLSKEKKVKEKKS